MDPITSAWTRDLTADDLRAYAWQSVVETAVPRDCLNYYGPLFGAAKGRSDSGDPRGESVYAVLGLIAAAQMPVQRDSVERPIDHLTQGTLAALTAILPEIQDAEMRAKVADILWYRTKNHKVLPVGVEGYIETAKVLWDVEKWPVSVERIERALKLGQASGKNGPYYKGVVAFIEDTLKAHEDREVGLASEHLMGLLYAYRAGDTASYSKLAGKIAQRLAGAQNWHFARRYLRLKAAWDGRNHDPEASSAALLQAAETYVKEAEGVATLNPRPNYFSAAHWMTKAVKALREAKADPTRIGYAHKKLLEFQRLVVEHEMQTLAPSADELPWMQEAREKMVSSARALVKGLSLEDAVLQLVGRVARPVNPVDLRQRVEVHAREFIINHLTETMALSATGKVTDTKPPISPQDSDQTEETTKKEMFQQAREVDWQLKVKWQIEPAREQIQNEHALLLRDLSFLVEDNPMVPRGRENIFLRGLHAGFVGDFVVATHLLLPQLENSIRNVLDDHGIITSKLVPDNTQDERDLGWLLTRPEMETLFGSEMAFDLRGVLIERFGYNLRNEVAHGLLSENGFFGDAAIYAWWLILRICTLPPTVFAAE